VPLPGDAHLHHKGVSQGVTGTPARARYIRRSGRRANLRQDFLHGDRTWPSVRGRTRPASPTGARFCRIEGVARSHAYALIGMFTRNLRAGRRPRRSATQHRYSYPGHAECRIFATARVSRPPPLMNPDQPILCGSPFRRPAPPKVCAAATNYTLESLAPEGMGQATASLPAGN